MASIREFEDYRPFLQSLLREKVSRNPSFSLRRLAASCDVSPACLSRIFSGNRRLSAGTATKISNALRMSAKDAAYLQNLVALERTRKPEEKSRLLTRLSKDRSRSTPALAMDIFATVADWYHFAILSLSMTKDFRANPFWIAQRLAISVAEAKIALQRLVHVGLLKEKDGRWVVVDADIQTSHDVNAAAVRENHRQHLEKATKALTETPVPLREFSNLAVCMNVSRLSEAKKRLRDFVDSFNAEFDQPLSDEVFQLNLQLYPLTTVKKGSPRAKV